MPTSFKEIIYNQILHFIPTTCFFLTDKYWIQSLTTNSYLFPFDLTLSHLLFHLRHLLSQKLESAAVKNISLSGIKIGYYHILGSIPRMLNWASEEYQINEIMGSRHAIWTPPVASRSKAAGRLILFRHFWNMQFQMFFTPILVSFIVF